jgi:hypothetical protein
MVSRGACGQRGFSKFTLAGKLTGNPSMVAANPAAVASIKGVMNLNKQLLDELLSEFPYQMLRNPPPWGKRLYSSICYESPYLRLQYPWISKY